MRMFAYVDDDGNPANGEIEVFPQANGSIHYAYPDGWHVFRKDREEIIRVFLPNHLTKEEKEESIRIFMDHAFAVLSPLHAESATSHLKTKTTIKG